MDDRQVLHAAAEELTDSMSRVVVHPTIGWAVKAPGHADFPVLPLGVEAEPELDGLLLELQACLDDLVAEQQQQYKQYEARLARMSPEERELFYSRNTGDAVYDTIIDDTWQTLKAAPAVLEKAARAFPGFYKNTLKTLWKIALTPSRMGILIGQGIATGNYNPLQQEIDSIVTPLAATREQALEYKSMLTVLFQDEEIYAMLYDFAERYWDATHPVERTRMTASAVSDVLVTLIIAIFTAGVGVAVNVAAKAGKLGKAAKLLKKITETIKRTAGRHQVLERNLEGGGGTTARTGSVARKGGVPEVESPKIKPDETKLREYDTPDKSGGPKTTTKTQPQSAESRAKEIHQAVPEPTQRRTTVAVTETKEGTRVISSSERRLRPAQRKLLKKGEVEGVGPGHAEVTGVKASKEIGLKPTGTAASRPICNNCAEYLGKEGVDPLSPLK
jgi:hypothetical protein